MSRTWIASLVVFGGLLAGGVARAAPSPSGEVQAVGPTVYLTVSEPDHDSLQGVAAPLLERELVRQAFLIAARDELGLSTRDVILREDFPEKPNERSMPFELFCRTSRGQKDFDVEYVLRRRPRQDAAFQPFWHWTYNTDINNPKSLETLAEKAEAFSRGGLKDVLLRSGWGKTPPAARASADVSSDTRDLLWSWNEISVFAGLRRVHNEIRENGESPELLAALAVGYANLGSLTEYYYNASCKAFFARGLLYAERLLRKTDDSPWALWHRAYVRMLVGLHNFAAADIAEAKKKQGTANPAKALPFWTDVLEAFGQGQLSHMVKIAKTEPQRRLARYLDLQAVAQGTLDDVRVKASRELIKVCGDCPRAYDTLGASQSLGPRREAAYEPFRVTSVYLRKRLPDVPGLPEKIAKRLHASDEMPEGEPEITFRKDLAAELKQAGAPDRDRGEPSLSALGHAIDEINFAQVMRRLEFEARGLGVPTDETAATFGPLCAEHPYGAFIKAYVRSKADREAAATELLKHLDPPAFTFKQQTLLAWLNGLTPSARLHDWYQIAGLHSDMIFSDEMRGIYYGQAGPPDDRKYNRPYMMKCWNTSNKLPLAVAMRVSRDWAHARQQTDLLERDYADDPMVMNALAKRYYSLKRYDDAERCAKLQVQYSPSFTAYRMLASVYKAKDDRAHWKETLEKVLDIPVEGLEHAQIRNEIAKDFMKHNEWAEAVVYADAAAESYSAWSLLTAARCHEMLGHWKKSEGLVRAVAERYEERAFDWMYWCHRTGRGEVHAADESVRAKIEAMGTTLDADQYRSIGQYYVMTGEPDKALLLFQRAYEKGHEPFTGLHAALFADSLGKSTERDEMFRQVLDTQMPANSPKARGAEHYRHLTGQLLEVLPPKGAKQLNLAEVDKILTAASGNVRGSGDAAAADNAADSLFPSTLPYFVGLFLKNRGNTETAKKYLLRCARADDWNSVNHVFACQLLREMKVEIPHPTNAEKLSEPKKAAVDQKPKGI